MRMRSVAFGVIFGVLLSVIVFVIARRITSATSPATALDPVSVVHQIQRLNELVSVKYTVQKVVGVEEQKVPFGSEKLLLFVQAAIASPAECATMAFLHANSGTGSAIPNHLGIKRSCLLDALR